MSGLFFNQFWGNYCVIWGVISNMLVGNYHLLTMTLAGLWKEIYHTVYHLKVPFFHISVKTHIIWPSYWCFLAMEISLVSSNTVFPVHKLPTFVALWPQILVGVVFGMKLICIPFSRWMSCTQTDMEEDCQWSYSTVLTLFNALLWLCIVCLRSV